jgi:predicted deacylase
MQADHIELAAAVPGQRQTLQVLRFGTQGARPKATIQAALHADEVPGLLVAQQLRLQLQALEDAGQLLGEVQLVPYANPLGLAQQLLGQHQGRFDLADGLNFNRFHPELGAAAGDALQGRLGDDAAANVEAIRSALRAAAAQLGSAHPVQDLKHKLVRLAIDSDIVLDLHCDSEAVMHLYALTPHAEWAAELGALLRAQAVLLATESGDSPFDEACSRPWLLLQQRFAPLPVPAACFSVTVELRGEADTSHALAQQDAAAIIEFLRRRGLLAGAPAPLPAPLCQPTPLAGSEPVSAPQSGVVVFHRAPGDRVAAGDVVADVVDVDTGAVLPVRAHTGGVLYARSSTRWATPGKRLAKIAGTALARTGKLLSP